MVSRRTGSADSVASFTPLALNSSYFKASRPISVGQTGCDSRTISRYIERSRRAYARPREITYREVSWMGEQDCPGPVDPLVPVHVTLCRLSGEVGHDVAQT